MRDKKLRNTNLLASRHITGRWLYFRLTWIAQTHSGGLGHINQPWNHNHSLDTKSRFYLNSPTSPLCLRPFWGLRHMRPHQKFYSHTELGLPVEKPVGTPAYVSKCMSSLSQGKNNENEIHSLMKIEKKGKYDYNISLYFLNFNIKIKLT